jgi:hypothetical protein
MKKRICRRGIERGKVNKNIVKRNCYRKKMRRGFLNIWSNELPKKNKQVDIAIPKNAES